jgi:hypothetical protein
MTYTSTDFMAAQTVPAGKVKKTGFVARGLKRESGGV